MRLILMLHGPNLNRLGHRDPQHYGSVTFSELEEQVKAWGLEREFTVRSYQSNHEGALIDEVQRATEWADGAIVNLGAYSHTSYALHDALLDFGKPVVEVHLSKISERESWRQVSVIRPACAAAIEGLGPEGYRRALDFLAQHLA